MSTITASATKLTWRRISDQLSRAEKMTAQAAAAGTRVAAIAPRIALWRTLETWTAFILKVHARVPPAAVFQNQHSRADLLDDLEHVRAEHDHLSVVGARTN